MITTSTIYTNTKNINDNNGLLDVAMECASFLEQIGAFAFKNWIDGEIIEGPIVEKYYVTIKLMFPNSLEPDPAVVERLTNLNCDVNMVQDVYRRVVNIRSKDYDSAYSQEGFEKRLFEHNVWVITIKIPQRYLPLDGDTQFVIDGEYSNYSDLEAVYVNDETEALNGEGGGEGGGDDDIGMGGDDFDDELGF